MPLTFADIKARFEAERQQARPLRTLYRGPVRGQMPLCEQEVQDSERHVDEEDRGPAEPSNEHAPD